MKMPPLLDFQTGAETVCAKPLSRLNRRLGGGAGREPRVLETILCPHAGPFTTRARWRFAGASS